MELVQELLMTAVFAVIFSFLVAKLVSMAVTGDDRCDSTKNVDFETVVEEMKFDGGLRVQSHETSKRSVQFVEQVLGKVDQIEGERSVQVHEESPEVSLREEIRDAADRIEVEGSTGEVPEVVGSPEKSSVGFDKEEAVAVAVAEVVTSSEGDREEAVAVAVAVEEVVGAFGYGGVKEDAAGTGTDGLAVEERSGSTKDDEVVGFREEENMVSSLVVEEKTVGSLVVEEKIGENDRDDDGTGVESVSEKIRGVGSGENYQGSGIGGELKEGSGIVEEELVSDEDDWEGIERSELDKDFAAAANYVGYGGKDNRLGNLGSDVQMQLYGLQKVAMEGPCYEPQPMALKVSARAKWNAWQSLGNMSSEVAMEQYITLLSDRVPGWMEGGDSAGDGKQGSLESGIHCAPDSSMATFLNKGPNSKKERSVSEVELKTETGGGEGIVASNIVNKDKE
ncbi:acyl-CoA-binding domain-containing protein 3-like isoform X1 [Cornus florida]|uniref:acyl-CoA-binding domain-containing protein 3-like isoform X1 n=1 Tax=Cornus florida TaxID=4283 RepID=UPI002899235B|nr:acyl-CoA-binding domain-containing protein 3-like isoform X1 [Cornus florida]